MEGTSGARIRKQHQSSTVSPSSSVPEQGNQVDKPPFGSSEIGASMHQYTQNLSPENAYNSSKKPAVPYPHPHLTPSASYAHLISSLTNSHQLRTQNFRSAPSHSRSLSQPTIFSLDCLPPLSPSPYFQSGSTSLSDPIPMDFSKEELHSASNAVPMPSPASGGCSLWGGERASSDKGHRRSNSDIPFGFSTVTHSSPQLMPICSLGNLDSLTMPGRASTGVDYSTIQPTKREFRERDNEINSGKEVVDDLFSTYMNLDNINSLNPCGIGDKGFDSRASGTNGSDTSNNKVESNTDGNPNGGKGEAKDREEDERSKGDNVALGARHFRSISMDSFMGNIHCSDEFPVPPASPQTQLVQQFQVSSLDDNSAKFWLDSGNGVFSAAELEKIMANDRLAEIASSDPKRAKRILANRQSAARSKERKMRYISELEHKVQTLQTEATTLSTQVTLLQRDTDAITSQNNELKFRIQAMEQQGQLKDALNEALTVEVQRLRLAAAGLNGDGKLPSHTVKEALNESLDVQRHQQHQPHPKERSGRASKQ